ncbi:MAG TPA: heme biosynthesis HemY N-terminal domain-containing protein [Acetobacteraceae bacterium]|nr:heme biosynthesis HemY N-terminal domain-containing protein [Acetobacteraceae bacterium]
MIRVIIYLIVVGLLAFGAVWLADRPGSVVITWQNRQIETSVMVLMVAVTAVAVLATVLWSALRAVLRSPALVSRHLRARRGLRGYSAVSQGLIAVGSGDAGAARKFADEAKRLAPAEPLTLLLTAQASQLAGDRGAAEGIFHAMAAREDTRLLGLHGLFIEARRRGDAVAARLYAEDAANANSVPAWAGHAVLEFRCAAGDWTGALDRLERNMRSGLIDRSLHRRQRAVLLTAQALAAEEHDRDAARALALEAVRLAPALVPAAALAGRLLGEKGELRKAARIVEAAWQANPHPDLADTYAHLRPGVSARDRLKRIESLADKTPGNIEGALAVARAALDAQEFAMARRALEPLLVAPTQRVAMLMAELEEREHGDEGRAREWMTRAVHARRDPAWTADGFASDRWLPVSPVTGRLDAFEWKDPLTGSGGESAAIEDAHQRRALIDAPPERTASMPDAPAPGGTAPEAAPEPVEAATPSPQRSRESSAKRAVGSPATRKVIPLLRVPDDPGPEPDPRTEPQREAASGTPNRAWQRLRELFR